MWGKTVLLVALLVALAGPAEAARKKKPEEPPAPPYKAEVTYVKDGDSFVIKTPEGGTQDVRFIDINTPEGPHDGAPGEPLADVARARVRELTQGKTVTLKPARQGRDKYDRVLADVVLPDGVWLNELLVREGLAHVYTFGENAMHPAPLLKAEQAARAAGKGIWALPRWQVKDAANCCAAEHIGIFQVIQGKVLSTGQGSREIFLNFGTDYKTDFTVVIEKRDLGRFKKENIDPLTAYVGKAVRVHGFADPVQGVEVRVDHPAQIEIVN